MEVIKHYRRINVMTGPGSGKSSTTAWLFSELKIRGINVEYVHETVKKWAYEKKSISSFDHVYLFAKQMHNEDSYLKNGADFVISDSPILQVGAYSKRNGDLFADEIIGIANKFDKLYPSINIFLDREGIKYKSEGRYENYEEAVKTDMAILDVLKENVSFSTFRALDRQLILEHVLDKINASAS